MPAGAELLNVRHSFVILRRKSAGDSATFVDEVRFEAGFVTDSEPGRR